MNRLRSLFARCARCGCDIDYKKNAIKYANKYFCPACYTESAAAISRIEIKGGGKCTL